MTRALMERIRAMDPDGWEFTEPTDADRARFRRDVITRFGIRAWRHYCGAWDQ